MPEKQVGKLFRSTEELESEEALVNGKLPEYVQGSFIRVGPGKFDLENNFTMNHFMDGYAILSKFCIRGDCITYQKKFVQSDAYKKAMIVKKPVVPEFGTRAYPDPTKNFFSRFMSSLFPSELSDNDQLAIFKLGNKVFASSETAVFREFNPCSLDSKDKYDSNKYLGLNICTAHPLTDEVTGITYNLGSTLLTGFKYHIVKIPPAEKPSTSAKEQLKNSKTLCTISSRATGCLSYMHSFGMTKNYIIIVEQPYMMNITKAMGSILKGQSSPKEWLEWRPELKNRFYIIEKTTGKLVRTEINFMSADPFFFLHFVNCWEEDYNYDNRQLVVDIVAYDNPSIIENMQLSQLRAGSFTADQPCAQRFVVPLLVSQNDHNEFYWPPENINLVECVKSTATAIRKGNQIILTPEILTEKGFEFPQINTQYCGKKQSFFWATGGCAPGHFENSICKVDTRKKEVVLWRESSFHFPGEPMFIPNPNAQSEDDGVIVTAVTNTEDQCNDFVIFLDAKTMAELGRAQFRAHIPQACHGIFLNDVIS